MKAFSRIDDSIVGQWWWSVDRWLFFTAIILMIVGGLLSLAASPPVAARINLPAFYFVQRHLAMLPLAIIVMITVSMLSIAQIRHIAWLGLGLGLVLLVLTPFIGTEIKGARRWINIAGFSLQVSEFIKPTFAVIAAWLFSASYRYGQIRMWSFVGALYGLIALLLVLQPDFGMVFVVTGIWGVQLFLAGLPIVFIVIIGLLGTVGAVGAYYFFPHVASRVDRFLNPEAGDQYQIRHSMDAFMGGGWFGKGPGEGIVKRHLPDAHADFVFSVAGEEFGYILCVSILGLYVLLIGRSYYKSYQEKDLFLMLAIVGLTTQFMLQTFVNIASSLHLIPTKGMTLPFLSYGGSSLIAISISMGMILALTRTRKTKGYV